MAYTDPTLVAGTTQVRKSHIDELRASAKTIAGSVKFASGSIVPTFTDDVITAGTTKPRKVHLDELRAAINNMEAKFSGNCNCTDCTNCGTCQSCQSVGGAACQSGGSYSCQSQCSKTCQSTGATSCQSCQKAGAVTCQSAGATTCQSAGAATCQSCMRTPSYNCGCGTCFPAGSMVLMADGTEKPLEEIQAGDMVIGVDGKASPVIAPYRTFLGPLRTMMKFKDGSMAWSAEHLMWVRTQGWQYFGTYDFNQYMREKMQASQINENGIKYTGLTKHDPIVLYQPVEFATKDGWKFDEAVMDNSYPADTPLFSAVVGGSHTMIVNGYVVGGFVDDTDFDYSGVIWEGLKAAEVK